MSGEANPSQDKIECKIDGAMVHSVERHIRTNFKDSWTLERYQREFPNEPIFSPLALRELQRVQAEKAKKKEQQEMTGVVMVEKRMADVFGIPDSKTKNARGTQIMVNVMTELSDDLAIYLPRIDPNYIFDIELTRTNYMALVANMPLLLWGMHGTGKTTAIEQTAARLNWPFSRVQHTINTEEAHIVGQYIVRNGETVFNLGPLPIAMLKGMIYCADEYDFAMPHVTSVYQPVLEGKALVIKDAPPEFRIIEPHPNFRFVATGNTNGAGDDTGLYQGTQMQNAANYSRFGVTEEVGYMMPEVEAAVVASQSGIDKEDAANLVKFAKEVRDSFRGGKVSATISPRELIGAGKIGAMRGNNWRAGLEKAFMNRLNKVDRETMNQYAQRVFGGV